MRAKAVTAGYIPLIALLVLAVAGCNQVDRREKPARHPDAIRVASFDFAESEVLAEIYAIALERKQFEVERLLKLASREVVIPALEQDRIDLVPEYLGSALEFITLGRSPPQRGTRAVHRQLTRAMEQQGIDVLRPAPAQNQNVIVVAKHVPRWHTLRTISDLIPVAGDLSFGGPPECPNRPLCLPGLEALYGVNFSEFVPLDGSGPLTTAALANGEIDAALMFSTDPSLNEEDVVVLADDKELQPPENVVPAIRHDVVERHGSTLVNVLNAVSAKLTTLDLREFNRRVRDGAAAKEVASEWLELHGF